MRRPAVLFVLAVAVAAWPIGASPEPPLSSPATSKTLSSVPPRRSPTVDEALALAPPSASRLRAPIRSRAPTRPVAVDDACRAACAQTYYFCAAGEPGDCGGSFSQCAAACDAPGLALGVPDLAH